MMNFRSRAHLRAFCLAPLLAALFLVPAQAASTSGSANTPQTTSRAGQLPSGLEPGEQYYSISNGCGYIAAYTPEQLSVQAMRDGIALLRKYVWTGECREGLMNGTGAFLPADMVNQTASSGVTSQTDYVFGRSLGITRITSSVSNNTSYALDNRYGSLADIDNKFTPVWGDPAENGLRSSSVSFGITANGIAQSKYVATLDISCFIDTAKFSGCDTDNDFRVYGLTVAANSGSTTVWCPDPRSTKGCDVLWQQQTADIIPQLKTLIADVNTKADEIQRESSRRFSAWISAKEAQRAEADRAEDEREARAEAERKKAQAAFEASLKSKNAGELFAQADRLKENGEMDNARETLRALISRFPNSPLAVTAAQQLSSWPHN